MAKKYSKDHPKLQESRWNLQNIFSKKMNVEIKTYESIK